MNQIEQFSTKEEVLQYAETLGITLKKHKSIDNLKKDLLQEIDKQLTLSTSEVEDVVLTTIEGEDTITVYHNRVEVTVLQVSQLEQYCKDTIKVLYSDVLQAVDKPWVNVHGYSFKENKHG